MKSILNVEQPSRTRRNVSFQERYRKGRTNIIFTFVRLIKYVECNIYIETLEVCIHIVKFSLEKKKLAYIYNVFISNDV